eukprot:3376501-Rhodomonas_salina.1
MKVVQQTQDKYINFLEIAMSQGHSSTKTCCRPGSSYAMSGTAVAYRMSVCEARCCMRVPGPGVCARYSGYRYSDDGECTILSCSLWVPGRGNHDREPRGGYRRCDGACHVQGTSTLDPRPETRNQRP